MLGETISLLSHKHNTQKYTFRSSPSKYLLLKAPRLVPVIPIINALHVLDDLFHLFGLTLPFRFAHFAFPLEEFLIWLTVTPAKTIPEGRELAIIVVEVQMVHGVAGGPIDDR